jgi:hypothetical protein
MIRYTAIPQPIRAEGRKGNKQTGSVRIVEIWEKAGDFRSAVDGGNVVLGSDWARRDTGQRGAEHLGAEEAR